MSLYSGITFGKDGENLAANISERPPNEPSPTPASEAPTNTAEAENTNWSASLKFAPVNRKKPPRPNALSGIYKASIVASAAPSSFASKPDESQINTPQRFGKTISKPPPMTLDEEDVNGFNQTMKGKRSEKKRKSKKNKKVEDPSLGFGPVPYEPSRPCDYLAYKAYIKIERAKRRLDEENRRNDSEYTSDEEGGDRPAYKRYRTENGSTSPPPALVLETTHLEKAPISAAAPSTTETGEEAYLRRLAMSQKSAMPDLPKESAPPPSAPPPSFIKLGAVGSSFVPATSFGPAKTTISQPLQLSAAAPAFTPSQAPPAPPSGVPSTSIPTADQTIRDATAKAREIAMRLGKIAAESTVPDNRSFAEKMMAKMGWEEGKGLGATGTGVSSALEVLKPVSKKQGKGAAKSLGMAAHSGAIIDSSREERRAAEREKMGGDHSRVVLLTNLCGISDVDDGLRHEVSQEANKIGLVERCMVHLVPGAPDDEAVRIFLVMSGVAGGYNAVKQFDGRYFGGRVVKARYYSEQALMRGEYLAE